MLGNVSENETGNVAWYEICRAHGDDHGGLLLLLANQKRRARKPTWGWVETAG